jgi:hypothetical protein
MSTSKLRLGPLPKTDLIKLTVTLPTELKQRLERYAQLHSQTHGEPVDAAALIPHMLDAFIAHDREFLRRTRKRDNVSLSPPPPSS